MGHFGDSGSMAGIEVDGTLLIAGVKSNGQDAFYGSQHEYTRVGGLNAPWIKANLASPDEKVSVENCNAFPGYDGNNGGGDDDGDNGDYDFECESECNCDYDDEQCW